MDFRTEVKPDRHDMKITYQTGVMLIGSCFSDEMAGKMEEGCMPVLSNPSGTIYNPASIASTLRDLIRGRTFEVKDLWNHGNKWLSFSHYTEFSSYDSDSCLERINSSNSYAARFLKKARFLLVTFGTARVYRRIDTGEVVSNCHKIPQSFFSADMPGPENVAEDWSLLLDELAVYNPSLKVIFTVSPVRHWKDGPFGNQVSKSVLFLAISRLLSHNTRPGYFPSYEIVMDDLRDYRFYSSDMLHPSEPAVNYIWEKFSAAFLDTPTEELRREIASISKATRHTIVSESREETVQFAMSMLTRIGNIEKRYPGVNLTRLKEYFMKLGNQ